MSTPQKTYATRAKQGEPFHREMTWTTGGDPAWESPVGWTARMQLRKGRFSPTVLHELTTENEGITLGDDGAITWDISAVDMDAMPPGRTVFDIEVVDPDGKPKALFGGSIYIEGQITR